ncbi:hypothetical protein JCM19045_3889 [Bacillus sp. JCM 19045]|nr:hypothetical protein JCM19045_3889 [Bacillus sp. JCM 19045]
MTDKLISQLNQAPDLTTNQRVLLIEQMHEIAYEPAYAMATFTYLTSFAQANNQQLLIG